MRLSTATLAFVLAAVCETVLAQTRPTIPNSALPGREREQLLGKPGPQPGVPQIELRDGRPKPVIELPRKNTPSKRSKRKGSRR
jgi:hypothetical protein